MLRLGKLLSSLVFISVSFASADQFLGAKVNSIEVDGENLISITLATSSGPARVSVYAGHGVNNAPTTTGDVKSYLSFFLTAFSVGGSVDVTAGYSDWPGGYLVQSAVMK
jgi:hypothetical protein